MQCRLCSGPWLLQLLGLVVDCKESQLVCQDATSSKEAPDLQTVGETVRFRVSAEAHAGYPSTSVAPDPATPSTRCPLTGVRQSNAWQFLAGERRSKVRSLRALRASQVEARRTGCVVCCDCWRDARTRCSQEAGPVDMSGLRRLRTGALPWQVASVGPCPATSALCKDWRPLFLEVGMKLCRCALQRPWMTPYESLKPWP